MRNPAARVRHATSIARNIATLAISLSATLIGTNSQAAETHTQSRPVPSIQVNTDIYGYRYYLYNPAGWGAAGCEGAIMIQIVANEPGGKEMLMVATLAHTTGKNVFVWGECLNDTYMRGKAIQIVP